MDKVFLSYSTRDHFFAELAKIRLAERGIELWQDISDINPGEEWSMAIDTAIRNSKAVVVAVSQDSVASDHVTYEWSYALGAGCTVIPVRLNDCSAHPKLRDRQWIDFSNRLVYPWKDLVAAIEGAEREDDDGPDGPSGGDKNSLDMFAHMSSSLEDQNVKKILKYLNSKGYQMASFERLRANTGVSMSDSEFKDFISANNRVFRRARLKPSKPGGKTRAGLKKLIP